jgi:hypothetical protein
VNFYQSRIFFLKYLIHFNVNALFFGPKEKKKEEEKKASVYNHCNIL